MRFALALALVACGYEPHRTTDANMTSDVATDLASTGDDAPATAVKLTVTNIGMPVPGVAVLFQAADSSLVTAAVTNDRGFAWAMVPSGGYVTAIRQVGSGLDELSTFTAVEPGDRLVLAIAPTGETKTASFTFSAPPWQPVATETTATSYQVSTSCGSFVTTGEPTSVTLDGCAGLADFVVIPVDAEGNPAGYALYQPGVSVDGQTVVLTGTYEAFVTTTFSYTNVPAAVQWIGTFQALSAERRAFERTTGEAVSAASATTTLQMPAASANALTVSDGYPAAGELGRQQIYESHVAGASYALDVGAAMLRRYATPPGYDPSTRVLTWTEHAGGATANVVRARIQVHRDDIPSGRTWGWSIVGPRSGTAVGYPELPSAGFDFNPQASDVATVSELTTASVPGGYAAVRANGFAELAAIPTTPGRAVIQTLFSPEL